MSLPSALLAAVAPETVQAAAKTLLADGRFQTTLPSPEDSVDLSFLAPFLKPVLWVGLVAVSSLLGFWVFTRLIRLNRRDAAEPTLAAAEVPGSAVTHLANADRLAANGAFAEALHEVLLASFLELERRIGTGLPLAFTSREVLRHAALPEGARTPLAALIEAVEVALFGGAAVGPSEYRAARLRFDELRVPIAPRRPR